MGVTIYIISERTFAMLADQACFEVCGKGPFVTYIDIYIYTIYTYIHVYIGISFVV